MKDKLYLLLAVVISQPLFSPVLANAGEGERGMMHYGYGGFYLFFFVVFKAAVIIAFFWFLLRIARALEKIAESKS